MKNSISLRAAAFIIALVLAVGVLAGCSKTGNGDGTSDTGSPAATTAPAETTAPADTTPTALSVLGEKDFGGDTVTFYSLTTTDCGSPILSRQRMIPTRSRSPFTAATSSSKKHTR